MKEKLIELLLSAEKVADEEGFFNCHKSRPKAELIADYLIQNGVVVLPCKAGDTVYIKGEAVTIDFIHIDKTISYCVTFDCYERDCGACSFYEDDVSWEGEHDCRTQGYYEFTADDIGKTVFLSREEAERVLKGE